LTRTKRLGPEKFEEPEIEVLLTDQLPSRMRLVKPAPNPIKDRFVNLQRRNVIETRSLKNYHRRYKLKIKEKRTHREYTEEQAKKYSTPATN